MPAAAPASFELARAVADAVLYEGYLLYPYRRSSGKNRVRWQFGVLAPRPWLAATGAAGVTDTSVAGSADAWHQQTECLLEAADTVRSFDPCLPCGVHMHLGGGRVLKKQHSPMFGASHG